MLGANGFPTEENYAEGLGTAKAYEVSATAQDYAGQHLKLTLSGNGNGTLMGAVTAESVWLSGSGKTRFSFQGSTFEHVGHVFLSGVNGWLRNAPVTLPCDLTLGAGGSGNDSANNYVHAALRLERTLTVAGRTTVPAGQVVKVAPDNVSDTALLLNGGLSGAGELRIGGSYKGTPMACSIVGGDFTGTLGLYNDASAVSNGTLTLDGADLCPSLDMGAVKNGTLTVNVSRAMGLGDGSRLVAGRLNVTDLPGTETAVFTLAPGVTVTLGEALTLNLPASAKPGKSTGDTTYRLFDLSGGGKVEGSLSAGQILFAGEAATCAVSLGADGTLALLTAVPTLDATGQAEVAAAYGDFDPAASAGVNALLKVGATAERVTFDVPGLNTLTLDASAGMPEALELTGSLGATAGVALVGVGVPQTVTFAPEAGQTLDLGAEVPLGAFNTAETLRFTGAGTAVYHIGMQETGNLTACLVADGPGTYRVRDGGNEPCMDVAAYSVERPILTVKGGTALTLQALNFTGWTAQTGFSENVVTLLEGGADAAQAATLHRETYSGASGALDNICAPIHFNGHATMTLPLAAKTAFTRVSPTVATFKAFAGATAKVTSAPGASGPATLWVRNQCDPRVEAEPGATLTLDVVIADESAGETFTLCGGGETILTQANTAAETLTVTDGGTCTLSGEGATWAGPVAVGAGATLRLAAGATLPAMAITAEEGGAVRVEGGGSLTLGSKGIADVAFALPLVMDEGSALRIVLADEDYAKGSLTLPEALRGFAGHCVLIAPDGSQAEAVETDGTFTFAAKTVAFALPTGWAETLIPPVWAEPFTAKDNTAKTGYADNAACAQTVGGRPAVVVDVLGGETAGTVLIGGYPYGADEKTLSRDVWLKVSGGSHRYAIGGSDMQNYGGKPRHLSGNTVVNLSGGSVDYAYSCNLFDGKPSIVRGRHALVIDGDAVLKGSAAATAAIHGSGVTYSDVVLNLTVRNLQNDNSASQGIGVSPGWTGANGNNAGFLVGGGVSTRSNAPHKVTGDTSVCVELPEGTAGAFSKTLIGGNYSTQGSGTSSVSGLASVSVSAPAGVTFDRDIVGGSYGTSNATLTTGASEVTLAGGVYTGTVTAGSLGTNAKTTGDATLILDGADVSAATVRPGNVGGASRLVLKAAAAPKVLEPFDVIVSETPEDALTLPGAVADLSGVTGAFTLDASAVDTLAVHAEADIAFAALPGKCLSVVCPEGADRRFVCTVPAGVALEGVTFTVDGVAVEPRLEGVTLTLEPTVPGPFFATMAADLEWASLDWVNAEGQRAVSFADALAAGATLRATASATLTLSGDVAGEGTLAVEIAEGATLTVGGSGKLRPSLALTGSLTLAETASAAEVSLADAASLLTLDLGHGSGKHPTMVGKVSGEGRLVIRASGGDWDAGTATTSTLFADPLDVGNLSRPLELGDGLRKIRCAPKSFSIPSGKALKLAKGVQLRQLDTLNAGYGLVASPGAHLQDGGWGDEGCGPVRTGYTVTLNGPVSGASGEGEPPALFNAYAGTGNININGAVSGDGIATGSWGSGEDRAMTYNLNNGANVFSQLLIRNMRLSTTAQAAATVNAKAGALGGAAVTFGTENGQPNVSALNVDGDNAVASVTATDGGTLTLAAGVTLTVAGAADLSGLAALTVRVPDGPLAVPLSPLVAQSLTLDPAVVRVIGADGAERTDLVAEVGGNAVRIRTPVTFANGADAGLSASARAKAEAAANAAGVTEVTAVRVASGGKTLADAETFNGAVTCFHAVPECDAAGVVTVSYEFGIASVRTMDGKTFTVTVEVRGGTFAEGTRLTLANAAGEPLAGVESVNAPDGATTAALTVDASLLTPRPFKVKAVAP